LVAYYTPIDNDVIIAMIKAFLELPGEDDH